MQHQTWLRPANIPWFTKRSKQKKEKLQLPNPSLPSHQVKKQLVCLSCTLFHTAEKKWLYYWYVKLQQLLCQHLSLEYLREKPEGEPEGKDNLWSHLIFIHLTGKRALRGVFLVFWTPFYLCLQAAFFSPKRKAVSDSSIVLHLLHLLAHTSLIKK